MSRGSPDFSSAISFPTRKYFHRDTPIVVVVPGGGFETIFDVETQGTVEAGYLLLSIAANIGLVRIDLYIDGLIADSNLLADAVQYRMHIGSNQTFELTYYDPDGGEACLTFTRGLYFLSRYQVIIVNLAAGDLGVDGFLTVAIVN
jgi:hypothetical protein